jgi:hypothetical protein
MGCSEVARRFPPAMGSAPWEVAGNGPFPATATVRPMGSRFYGPRAIPALDALRSNLPANRDLLIQALVTQISIRVEFDHHQRALPWTIRDEGGLRTLPNSQRHQRDRRPVCLPHRLGIAVGGCQADSAALREPSMPGAARSWLGAADLA